MTFAQFEKLIKGKYPNAKVCRHGEFAGNKINIAVIFNPNGKVYRYNGTYCEVLNRLGIKAIYKYDLENAKDMLSKYIKDNGTAGMFGGIHDYTRQIEEWTAKVNDYETNYCIV